MITEATVATTDAVVETAEAVAPVVQSVAINPKKVAIVACGVLGIGLAAYTTKKIIDKRKEKKEDAEAMIIEMPISPEDAAALDEINDK